MSDTPTPRTDDLTNAAMILDGATLLVRYDTLARHARQLERELAEAVRCLRQINAECDLRDECGSDIDDAARAILARYKE